MKGKTVIAMAALFLGALFLDGSLLAAGEEKESLKVTNKIIIINEYKEVKPDTLSSPIGTTVIWVNHSKTPVEILFYDKSVTKACGSPVNFSVGRGGAYESGKIPFGGTASLCFIEKGRYDYMIKSSATFYTNRVQRDNKGVIVVE